MCKDITYIVYTMRICDVYRVPKGYENPLFEPARKWEKIREAKRKDWEANPTNRPGYFKEVLKRPKWHKYRTGGR